MARKDYRDVELVRGERGLIEGLQYSNKRLLDANEELRRAIQAKSESMSVVSHELRTLLNVIIGFAQLLLDEVPGKINEEQRQCLNDILNSSKRLLELINNDVLEWSETELGKV